MLVRHCLTQVGHCPAQEVEFQNTAKLAEDTATVEGTVMFEDTVLFEDIATKVDTARVERMAMKTGTVMLADL